MMTRGSTSNTQLGNQKKSIVNILLFILILSFCNISSAYVENRHDESEYYYDSTASSFFDALELTLTSAEQIIVGSLIAGTLLIALPVAMFVIPIAGIVIISLSLVALTTAGLMLTAATVLPIIITASCIMLPAIIIIQGL